MMVFQTLEAHVLHTRFRQITPWIFLAVTIAKNLLWLREGASVIFSPFGGYLSRFSFLRLTKNLKNRPPVALKIHQSNHLTTKHPKTTLNAQN